MHRILILYIVLAAISTACKSKLDEPSAQDISKYIDMPMSADQPFDKDRGQLKFDHTTYDFGQITEGDTISHDFIFEKHR